VTQVRRGALGTRAAVVLVALAAITGHAVADVVLRATPCENVLPAELEVTLRAVPLDPAVGDLVDLDVQITNTTGGLAGIPLFRLAGAEPLFSIESQENSYPYVEGARYRLRAAQPGLAALRLSVNFETSSGCVDLPLFVFHSTSSAPLPIAVSGDLPPVSGSPTPTATATPLRRWAIATPPRRPPSTASATSDLARCAHAREQVTTALEAALGSSEATCHSCAVERHPTVAITELIAVVNGTRSRCPTPPPTATAIR
jgi:hypothetical protein